MKYYCFVANPGPERHKTCLIINNIQSWAWQSVVVYPTFNDLRSWNMFFPLHCVKWVISWNFWSRDISRLTRRVADRNATCRETWRVGECHVPDTRDTACHDKSCPGYVNRGVSKNFKGLILSGTDIFCRRMNVFCVPLSLHVTWKPQTLVLFCPFRIL